MLIPTDSVGNHILSMMHRMRCSQSETLPLLQHSLLRNFCRSNGTSLPLRGSYTIAGMRSMAMRGSPCWAWNAAAAWLSYFSACAVHQLFKAFSRFTPTIILKNKRIDAASHQTCRTAIKEQLVRAAWLIDQLPNRCVWWGSVLLSTSKLRDSRLPTPLAIHFAYIADHTQGFQYLAHGDQTAAVS